MTRIDYNSIILKKIEKCFDGVIPLVAITCCISSYLINGIQIPSVFIVFNLGVGCILMLLYIFRRKIDSEVKIIIAALAAGFLGVLYFIHGGFQSSGITMLIIGNTIIVLFLSRKKGIIASTCTAFLFISLWVKAKYFQNPINPYEGNAIWSIQFTSLLLHMVVLYLVVLAIRKYLMQSIQELEERTIQTYNLAYYDQLTGLSNQFKFRELLTEREGLKIATGHIVLFSIKDLNLINSLYGETFGDDLIKKISKTITNSTLKSEWIARIDGNEYALWVEDLNKKNIKHFIGNFMSYLESSLMIPEMKKKVSFFVGHSHYSNKDVSIHDCLHNASLALTYAKSQNLLHPIAYDKSLDQTIREKEKLKQLTYEAVINYEFELYYQTKVNALTNEILGVEALARWHSPELGHISPIVFIPIIEKLNLSVAFGERTIINAFSQYQHLVDKYNKDINLSINISPTHIFSKGFSKFIKHQLKKFNINPSKIILEITEDIAIEGLDIVAEVISSLKAMGVCISLDDFGTGYSSLNYLIKLDIDELKIDKSFTEQVVTNDNVSIMLSAIIQLSKGYNLNIVAEGVETKEQCEKLLSLGCHIVQGYYFSYPEPIKKKSHV